MNHPCLLYTPNSGNTYYFRSKIPTDLVDYFNGLKEFRLSLKCAIKSRAIRTVKILSEKVSTLYQEIRQGMKSLEIEDIKEILRIEIRKQILHAHHVDLGTNKWDDSGVEKSLDSIQKKETNLKDVLKLDLKSYQREVDEKLEGILSSMDIRVEKDSVDYKTLRNHFIDLYLLRHDWMRELVEKTGKTDDQFRRDAEVKLGMPLFPDMSWMPEDAPKFPVNPNPSESTQTVQTPVKTTIAPILQKNTGETLSVSSKRYFDRKRVAGRRVKSITSDESIVSDFIEIVGDIGSASLSKQVVSDYIDVQTKLPPNRKKSPQYRDLSIQQLLELNLPDKETQTPQNINKRLTKLSSFGNWGVRQGLLNANPFRDMKLEVKKQLTQSKPFSIADLRDILKPEIYLDWTVNYKHSIYNEGGAKNQMPYYWIFPLGILSGLRTNEMCQLRLSDIRKENGVWFMHVEESEQTRVKTENAIRKVPVHPQLIDLGFIDYVGNLKRKRKDRVFWELTQTRDGYAKQVSRHYNEKYLPAVGVWEKRVKVLYCTRHTFINCLYSKKVDENVIKSLVGHEKEFTMKHYGGDPFTSERLLKEISKVSYSGIKWDRLKVV